MNSDILKIVLTLATAAPDVLKAVIAILQAFATLTDDHKANVVAAVKTAVK